MFERDATVTIYLNVPMLSDVVVGRTYVTQEDDTVFECASDTGGCEAAGPGAVIFDVVSKDTVVGRLLYLRPDGRWHDEVLFSVERCPGLFSD